MSMRQRTLADLGAQGDVLLGGLDSLLRRHVGGVVKFGDRELIAAREMFRLGSKTSMASQTVLSLGW